MRIVIVLFLIAIFASLGSALYFMLHGQGDSQRMFRALAFRVGLSITLFVLLMAAYYFGLIPAHAP